jgi:undecaprenyl-diphosphatase
VHFLQILILAIVQGAAELLPVSSSAHVIVAEKLMGLDPSSPEMTMILVMLHTGTMFAVIAYFWKGWQRDYFSSGLRLKDFLVQVIVATVCTGIVGYGIKEVIEKVFMHGMEKAEIEDLFSNLPLIAGALFAVGLLIIYSGLRLEKRSRRGGEIQLRESAWIGIVQGFCLPFRGFSRSGSTISTGLLLGLSRQKLEEFSFALAVVLTPPVIAKEALRLLKANKEGAHVPMLHLLTPSLVGMLFSFGAGLLALKWLSQWLEGGQWKLFGFYCVAASIVVLALHFTMGL